ISKLCEKGIRVITLKHHGHGGVPATIIKDSTRHRRAGALASVVEGDGVLHLEVGKQEWTVERIKSMLSFFEYDLLLIEGYKYKEYPKVVFLRNSLEKEEFMNLPQVQLFIPWCETIEEREQYLYQIVQLIEKKLKMSEKEGFNV